MVASEVKKLAQASQDASAIITRQLEAVQQAFDALQQVLREMVSQMMTVTQIPETLFDQLRAVMTAQETLREIVLPLQDQIHALATEMSAWNGPCSRTRRSKLRTSGLKAFSVGSIIEPAPGRWPS